MENQDASSNSGGGHDFRRLRTVRVLFLGKEMGDIAAKIAENQENTVATTRVTEAQEALRQEAFDCLVVQDRIPEGQWEEISDVLDCPVILYTGSSRTKIDREVLAAAQAYVDEQTDRSEAILARKIDRLATRDKKRQSGQAANSARILNESGTSACFLVDVDGTVHSESVSPGKLFEDATVWERERDFYRQVTTLTVPTSATSTNLLSLVQRRASRNWDLVETVGEGRQYSHASYPVPDSDRLRFEVFQPVAGGVSDDERRERDRKLADYRSLVESAGDPMYVVDTDEIVKMVNEAMADFVGEPREALVGAPVNEMLPSYAVEEAQVALGVARESTTRNYETFETWLTDAESKERLVEATIGPTTNAERDESGAVVTLRDVTERHKREQELDLIKQIFSRSLRHNIRNKASVIESFATLLADDLSGEHAEMAQAILRASNSLAQTSEKVSDFDWIVDEDFDIVEHDLTDLLQESVASVAGRTTAASIEFHVDEGIRVEGIRDLQYAFENLVENALEHGVSGGAPMVTIETEVQDGEVCVVVADEGPGIPESEIRVLEEGEETELEHGSGLGLWLVDQVVDQSGGDLNFHVDDGTEARVTLQRANHEE